MPTSGIREPILITGAGGFLGGAMVRRFQEELGEVRALLFEGENRDPRWKDNVRVFQGDVTRAETLGPAMAGVGTVFHNVARVGDWGPEQLFYRVAVEGTEHLVELALQENARFLLTSSITVNGDQIGQGLRTEDQPFGRPLGPYSRNKQKQEALALERYQRDDLQLTVIRPGNITGAGSQPWVHELLRQLHKRAPAIVGSGQTRFGLCHVENVVELFALAAAEPASIGRVYYALDELQEVRWADYVRRMAEIAGTPAPRSAPLFLARILAAGGEALGRLLRWKDRPPLTFEALNLVAQDMQFSIEKATTELGYRPKVGYEEALVEIADYVSREGL